MATGKNGSKIGHPSSSVTSQNGKPKARKPKLKRRGREVSPSMRSKYGCGRLHWIMRNHGATRKRKSKVVKRQSNKLAPGKSSSLSTDIRDLATGSSVETMEEMGTVSCTTHTPQSTLYAVEPMSASAMGTPAGLHLPNTIAPGCTLMQSDDVSLPEPDKASFSRNSPGESGTIRNSICGNVQSITIVSPTGSETSCDLDQATVSNCAESSLHYNINNNSNSEKYAYSIVRSGRKCGLTLNPITVRIPRRCAIHASIRIAELFRSKTSPITNRSS